jgi:hydroxypyruvate reductase
MKNRSAEQLQADALRIWHAGLDAVRSDRLVEGFLRVEGHQLHFDDDVVDLRSVRRIVVVGAGKAGAGMAAGLERALGPELLVEKQVTGWVNVPEDCVRSLSTIHLHGARPAGVNEPTEAGIAGALEIRRLVESVTAEDLCIALISGGASALLPAPIEGVSLADKLAITRFLGGAGANIEELNTVRKQLSQLKSGGLAALCNGRMDALVISDVLGDPLDTIGSGLTVENTSTVADAIAVLQKYGAEAAAFAKPIFATLEKRRSGSLAKVSHANIHNWIIGNNAVAVDSAGMEAERLGYSHAMISATKSEGPAEEVGRQLATMTLRMCQQEGPDCLISGGEPVVQLAAAEKRGRGGRNQQLVLAAMQPLLAGSARGFALLSAGTDGEDGPTDAAGAFCDEAMLDRARAEGLNLQDFLARNDAYTFFERVGGLIKTGPTHTNVCDLRVVVVDR